MEEAFGQERLIMPIGKVNDDLNTDDITYKDGIPISLPKNFGTAVDTTVDLGNVRPQADATLDSNPVTWTPSPDHFGNIDPNS